MKKLNPFSKRLGGLLSRGRLSSLTSVSSGGGAAPVNVTPPALTGDTFLGGNPLICSTGTWSGSPNGYTYQWYYGDTDEAIPGQNSNEYPISSPDAGRSVYCAVTASNAFGDTTVNSATLNLPAAYDLYLWGSNSNYRLGLGTTGGSYLVPTQIGTDTDWAYVQRGAVSGSVYAIKTDGTLWVWGGNNGRCLGLGTAGLDVQTPTQLGSDTDWAEVAGVVGGTIFRKYDGSIWVVGTDTLNDQLGLGDGVSANDLTEMTSVGTDNTKIGGHTYSGYILKSNDTVLSWGGMPDYAGQGSGTTDISVPTVISGLTGVEDIWDCSVGVMCLVKR